MSVTFSLYAEQEGGNPLWFETQIVQADAQGRYTVFLGATEPTGLPLDLFTTGAARWLAVQTAVSGPRELPRVLLVGVPYASKAADADTLGGKPASAFVTTDVATAQPNASAGTAVQTLAAPAVLPAATPAATIGGTGTTNFIPIWTNSTTLGNSTIFETDGLVGIGTTSPISTLDVNGQLTLPAKGTATGSAGFNSQSLDFFASAFNSSSKAAVNQHFPWEAEPVSNNTSSPSGKFDLLFGFGSTVPAETGLSISSKGIITFASGQTLPTVTGNETVNGELIATNSNGEAGNFTSNKNGATGLTVSGGPEASGGNGGIGIIANGGTQPTTGTGNNGGIGIVATGGNGPNMKGGAGVQAIGGDTSNGTAGAVLIAIGGNTTSNGVGGDGVDASGSPQGGAPTAGVNATGGPGDYDGGSGPHCDGRTGR